MNKEFFNIFSKYPSFISKFFIYKFIDIFFIESNSRFLFNYKLIKYSDRSNIKLSSIFPKKVDYLDSNSSYYNDLVNFRNVLIYNFDDYFLKNFYRNIKTLEIKKAKHLDCFGKYYVRDNLIIIDNDNYNSTFPHEMFHMSSSNVSSLISRVGFHVWGFLYDLGFCLNEGYTEVMASRYFNIPLNDSPYFFEICCALRIEDLVGRDFMEKSYMTADLFGVLHELSMYFSEHLVVNNIIGMDYVSRAMLKKNININRFSNYMLDVNLFLIFSKFKKEGYYFNSGSVKNNFDDLSKYNDKKYKLFYLECLTLYNFIDYDIGGNWHYNLIYKFFEKIGFENLNDVCFFNGISHLSNYIDSNSLSEFLSIFEYLLYKYYNYKIFEDNKISLYSYLSDFISNLDIKKAKVFK